jgi:hypothetical protein
MRYRWMLKLTPVLTLILGCVVYGRAVIVSYLRSSQCRHGTSPWARPDSWFCREATVGKWAGAVLVFMSLAALTIVISRRVRQTER